MDGPQNKSEEYPWVYKIQYAFKNLKLKSDFHLEWESKGIRVNKFIEISFVVNRNVFISEYKKTCSQFYGRKHKQQQKPESLAQIEYQFEKVLEQNACGIVLFVECLIFQRKTASEENSPISNNPRFHISTERRSTHICQMIHCDVKSLRGIHKM